MLLPKRWRVPSLLNKNPKLPPLILSFVASVPLCLQVVAPYRDPPRFRLLLSSSLFVNGHTSFSSSYVGSSQRSNRQKNRIEEEKVSEQWIRGAQDLVRRSFAEGIHTVALWNLCACSFTETWPEFYRHQSYQSRDVPIWSTKIDGDGLIWHRSRKLEVMIFREEDESGL